ncbi:hypothetical protein G0Q06_12910 [Puniceicoccales bacterium CK1056]|uniref:Uncharacterized protein n=1 Tax=Oceanipulchritudo coccoides TaxID=2706888 RepID=A0A6B2M319_9BACT|nr:hypothetical protein [Oceanipulchritudo coccoides]NDV63358.1 hypothetical protein [Oceanipulchritudo coccoides]
MNNILFMKVGEHASEPLDKIIERKQREYQTAGMTFWGYGGSACHPIRQVQAFAKRMEEIQEELYLFMNPVNSRHVRKNAPPATHYSVNGFDWLPVPDGIRVTGSKWALVLDEIEPCDLDIDLSSYSVGIGPSTGKVASAYMKGQTDKGCLTLAGSTQTEFPPIIRNVGFRAKLLEPYAVSMRYE